MRGTILASVFALAFLVCQAQAADLTLYAGYLNTGSLSLSNVINGLETRGSSIYGARFETDFHKVIGLEHSIAFTPNLLQSNIFPINTEVHGFLYHSNLVVNLPLGHLVPYATAGMGLLTPYGPGFKPFGTRFAFNYGGGLKLPHLAGILGLRFDVRGYAIPDVDAQTLKALEASGGLMFSFGSR